jgi:hypothetical protein
MVNVGAGRLKANSRRIEMKRKTGDECETLIALANQALSTCLDFVPVFGRLAMRSQKNEEARGYLDN